MYPPFAFCPAVAAQVSNFGGEGLGFERQGKARKLPGLMAGGGVGTDIYPVSFQLVPALKSLLMKAWPVVIENLRHGE